MSFFVFSYKCKCIMGYDGIIMVNLYSSWQLHFCILNGKWTRDVGCSHKKGYLGWSIQDPEDSPRMSQPTFWYQKITIIIIQTYKYQKLRKWVHDDRHSIAQTTSCLPDWSESQKHLTEGETSGNMRNLATYTVRHPLKVHPICVQIQIQHN